MSETISSQCPLPTPTFNAQYWDEISSSVRANLVGVALLFALYGLFVLLCGASIYSLIRNRLNTRSQPTILVLSVALLALFSSTTIYTVSVFLNQLAVAFFQVMSDGLALWSYGYSGEWTLPGVPLALNGFSTTRFLSCAPTATLTTNILLGDAIVCWRACVVWQGSRIVRGLSIMLLLTTFALGIVDTRYSCLAIDSGQSSWRPDPHADGNGSLYQGFSYGVTATALSLSTNIFATVVVATKGWQSRRALKQYVVTGPMASQVEKMFSILVESGMIYCALWVIILAWQAGTYTEVLLDDNVFWQMFDVIVNCALVPLIAIYPTIVIVIVALNRSHIENGFKTPSLNSVYCLPLRPPLTAEVNTTMSAHHTSHNRGSSESVLVISHEGFRPRADLEDSRAYMAKTRSESSEILPCTNATP